MPSKYIFKEFSFLEENFTPFSLTLSASEFSHFSFSHSHAMMLSSCYTSDPPDSFALFCLHFIFPHKVPPAHSVFFRPSGGNLANSLKHQPQIGVSWGNCSPQLLLSSLSRALSPAGAQGSCKTSWSAWGAAVGQQENSNTHSSIGWLEISNSCGVLVVDRQLLHRQPPHDYFFPYTPKMPASI